MANYISFFGLMKSPINESELIKSYTETTTEVLLGFYPDGEENTTLKPLGFMEGLSYEPISAKDSLTIYLSFIDEKTGHLVADCPAADWAEQCFVVLENGEVVYEIENK